jgi:hypothetical protein
MDYQSNNPPLGHYDPGTTSMKRSPGSYQRLDLFIKVVRVLCPNLTDASKTWPKIRSESSQVLEEASIRL